MGIVDNALNSTPSGQPAGGTLPLYLNPRAPSGLIIVLRNCAAIFRLLIGLILAFRLDINCLCTCRHRSGRLIKTQRQANRIGRLDELLSGHCRQCPKLHSKRPTGWRNPPSISESSSPQWINYCLEELCCHFSAFDWFDSCFQIGYQLSVYLSTSFW